MFTGGTISHNMTDLSACTRFRSENSCSPTKAFRVSRCSLSLHQNREKSRKQTTTTEVVVCCFTVFFHTFPPRSCRWPSCSVHLLCKETQPRTPLAESAGRFPRGTGRPGRRQEVIRIINISETCQRRRNKRET